MKSVVFIFFFVLAFSIYAQPKDVDRQPPSREPISREPIREPPEKKEKKGESDSVVFHGKKMPTDTERFAVAVIVVNKDNIMIFFNMPVNPRSFDKSDIYIDGKPLPSSASVKFNRSGKMLEITMPIPPFSNFTLSLNNVCCYTGESLEKSEFRNLGVGKSQTYNSDNNKENKK